MPEGLLAHVRLAGLLLRLGSVCPEPQARTLEMAGQEVDGYDPIQPRCGPLMLVHGLTLHGGRDPRLVRFAQALARSGVPCLVPTLPALADGLLEPSDLDLLERLLAASPGPVALAGFSFGASFALRVAARPGVEARLRALVSFGAYHDLGALLGHLLALPTDNIEPGLEDAAIFTRLLMAKGLRPGEQPELRAALEGYCDKPQAEKRRLREQLLATPAPALDPKAARWAELSPAGHIGHLRLPISLLHDRQDPLVPPSHAEALGRELAPHPDLRTWVTGALSHLKPALPRPWELRPMFRSLVALVR